MSANGRTIAIASMAVSGLVMVMLLSVGAAAQGRGADVTLRELQVFDNFLDAHPAIDKDLREDPTLAKNPTYLSAHPELRTFMQSHPGVQAEINKSPRFFVRRTEAFDRSRKDITLAEVRSFDAFLDDHPGMEDDLDKNPTLIRDPNFLAKHPDLREYLNRHPAVAADLRESPRAFMWRDRVLDRRQGAIQERGLAQRPGVESRGIQQQPRPAAAVTPNRGTPRGLRQTR